MIIELLNGTRIDVTDYNLALKEPPRIASIKLSHKTEKLDGRRGSVFLESKFDERVIPVDFVYKSVDTIDYILLRNDLNALFLREEAFFIIFKVEPYKRWLVRLNSLIDMEPDEIEIVGDLHIEFICENIFAESVGTSLQLAEQNFDSGLWGFGSKIDVDKQYNYRFSSNSFVVENIGDVEIEPCESELEITIRAVAAQYLQVRNNTTGETYRYNGVLSSTDELKITGVRSLKNGTSVFGATNGQLLTLAAGANSFSVTGGRVASIEFKFRFLYK